MFLRSLASGLLMLLQASFAHQRGSHIQESNTLVKEYPRTTKHSQLNRQPKKSRASTIRKTKNSVHRESRGSVPRHSKRKRY